MDTKLVKVHVEVPNHFAYGGESLWAEPLGNGLYRIDNVPFAAYGLNAGDIVLADESQAAMKPSVLRVVQKSGNATLRVHLGAGVSEGVKGTLLAWIKDRGASFEGMDTKLFAVNIPPQLTVDEVRRHLEALAADGIDYETCEERVPGSFGDHADGPGA